MLNKHNYILENLMKLRPTARLAFLGAFSALAACNQEPPAASLDPNAPSPTSSVYNDASGPPTPEQIKTLARLVERGEAKACGDQSVLNFIMDEAVAANQFPPSMGWTATSRAEFYATYSSDVKSIVLNAHDPVARSVTCGATYYEKSSSKQFWQEVQYDLQVTVDGGVVTRIHNRGALQRASMYAVQDYNTTVVYPRYQREFLAARSNSTPPTTRPTVNLPAPQADRSPSPTTASETAADLDVGERTASAAPAVITRTPPEPKPIPAPPRPQVISNPSWTRAPQGQFPAEAMNRGIETGNVALDCEVQPNGSLSRCNIVSETPSGEGFGQAAAQAAARARVAPRTVDSMAVGGRVRFNMRFNSSQP